MRKINSAAQKILIVLAALFLLVGTGLLLFGMRTLAAAEEKNDVQKYHEGFAVGTYVCWYDFDYKDLEGQMKEMSEAGVNLLGMAWRNIFNTATEDYEYSYVRTEEYWLEMDRLCEKYDMYYCIYREVDGFTTVEQWNALFSKLKRCAFVFVLDEPSAAQMASVAESFRYAKNNYVTDAKPWVNLFPSFLGSSVLGGSYSQYVNNWVNTVGLENLQDGYLFHDHYPLTPDGGYRATYFSDMEVMRKVAYENGKIRTGGFAQTSQWGSVVKMPTIDELRWDMYAMLAYGFKQIVHFNMVTPAPEYVYYHPTGERYKDSPILYDGSKHAIFDGTVDLNWEIRAVGDAMSGLDAAHAYHTQPIADTESLPEDFFVQPLSTSADFIISALIDRDGTDNHIMLYNKNIKSGGEESFVFDMESGFTGLEYFNPATKKYEEVKLNNGVLTESFQIGEGKLYRVKGNVNIETIEKVAVPRANLASGRYAGVQSVTLSAEEGTSIYYTTDGSVPSRESAPYTGAISIGAANGYSAHLIRAVAYKESFSSAVADFDYIVCPATESLTAAELATEKWTKRGGNWAVTSAGITKTDLYLVAGDAWEGSLLYNGVSSAGYVLSGTFSFGECKLNYGWAGFVVGVTDENPTGVQIGVNPKGEPVVWTDFREYTQRRPVVPDGFNAQDFALKVTAFGSTVVLDVNGTVVLTLSDMNLNIAEGQFGVHGGMIPVTVNNLSYKAVEIDPVERTQYLKMTETYEFVTIAKYTTLAEIANILPDTVKVWDRSGYAYRFEVEWDLTSFDRSQEGYQVVFGTLIGLPEYVQNPKNVAPIFRFFIPYAPDRTELNEAIAYYKNIYDTYGRLDYYTTATWEVFESKYWAAVAMQDDYFRQANELTIAVEQLKSAAKDLVKNADLTEYNKVLVQFNRLSQEECTAQSFGYAKMMVDLLYETAFGSEYSDEYYKEVLSEAQAAVKNVEKKGDLTELESAIAQAKALERSGTDNAWATELDALISMAEGYIAKEDLSENTVSALLGTLRNKMENVRRA